jgi:hypothetical protein
MKGQLSAAALLIVGAMGLGIVHHFLAAQDVVRTPPPDKIAGRFQFEVVECFDARYLGDTPGYTGRHGELGDFRPTAALGDPVYRGNDKVGRVTRLAWSRPHGSLEIEFDPEPKVDVHVGDVVWLKLGGDGG